MSFRRTMDEIDYYWRDFDELTVSELYAILKLRQQVFVVEQQCAYLDCDDRDQNAWHLVGWPRGSEVFAPVAYLRVMTPEDPEGMAAIGRLLLHPDRRGRGEGKKLLRLALRRIGEAYPHASIRISAQHHLKGFYLAFGFHSASEVYDEDGIPHIKMIRPPGNCR